MSERHAGFAFDERRNLLWSHDGQGRTVYAYDERDRLTGAVYPDGGWLALTYDRAGNVAERRSRGGASTRFSYDRAGRLTRASHTGGESITYRHDEAGRLVEAGSPGFSARYAYDEAGRPIRCEQSVDGGETRPGRLEFEYNSAGHLTGVKVPGFSAWLRYRYDDEQRLVALGYDSEPDLVRLEYRQADRQVVVRFANGVTQSFSMDGGYRIQQIQATSSEGEPILDLRYRSSATGNIVAVNDQRFAYDRSGQLIEQGPLLGERVRYRYDQAGNRLEEQGPKSAARRYEYDQAGRLVRWTRPNGAVVRCSYDAEGRLLARSDGRTTWAYRYDGLGRLVRVMRGGRIVGEYGYDHAGRCVLKRAQDETVVTYRDPWGNRIAEATSDGELRIFLGPAGQHLACMVVGNGPLQVLFLHPDHVGSIRAVTDEQGRVVASYDFEPFGVVSRRAGGAWPPVFGGHRFDADTGLYDCGSRWYDPTMGRFLSPDAYTFAADDPRLMWLSAPPEALCRLRYERLRAWQHKSAHRNRYAYALNNPLTYVDRDGHNAGLYFLYSLLAIFWALPYTIVGFLIFEVILNWITFAWAWDWDNHKWSGESSDRLGAWAWWTIGGLAGKIVIGGGAFTQGNFVIANADFINNLDDTARTFGIPARHGELSAVPFDPNTLLTERESVIEHELRHTNQFGWWGPFMMPWVLVLFFLVMNLLLTAVSAISREQVHVSWRDIWQTLTGSWWQGVLTGVGILLLPGAYWWDYIGRGGYSDSWFEQDAAHNSGSSNNINLRASASRDSVSPGGDAIVSVITMPNLVNSITMTVTTNNSGAPAPSDITSLSGVTNMKVFRYTAGANAGTDTLTASDGATNFELEIEVQ